MQKTRYTILDIIRGFALINMIAYHAIWDIVFIFGERLPWFINDDRQIWRHFICCTFILLSGFCQPLGSKKLKRALLVLGGSLIITAVTLVVMPENRIIFGILSLIGSAMLVMIPLEKPLSKINPYIGFTLFLVLFLLTKNINSGYLGIGEWLISEIPRALYANYFTAYLGFPQRGFYSTDYYAFFPWIFLYICGYFLYNIFKKHDLLKHLSAFRFKPLEFLGRHSLLFYMLHQPIVYGLLFVVFSIIN